MYVYGACLFYVCCSNCVGVCMNVCCVSAFVQNSDVWPLSVEVWCVFV